MRRPRRPTPLQLSDLRYDPKTNLYCRSQDGITYSMPLELTRHLKEYFRHYSEGLNGKIDYPSMDKWYKDLSKEQKKLVIRTGNVLKEVDDFFPDQEFN